GGERIDLKAPGRGDGDRVMARIDPQEGELEIDAADPVLDEVRDLGVEDLAPERDHRVGLARGDCDMAHAARAGHKAADKNLRQVGVDFGLEEQFERRALRPDEPPDAFDPAYRRLVPADLFDLDAARREPAENGVERARAADPPSEREVFGGALADDQASRVSVGPKGQRVGLAVGERHADSLSAEPLPFGETGRVDEGVSELNRAVYGGRRGPDVDGV